MILMEKENMVDGSCYVAVYESRKIGNSSTRGYVLVGKTETIAIDPNPEFVRHIALTNKNQDLRFEVYESKGSKNQDISFHPMT